MRLKTLILLSMVLATSGLRAQASPGVGLAHLPFTDPVTHHAVDGVAFYPSSAAGPATVVGPYRIDARPNAPLAHGRFPLIVFSPGTGGSQFDDHDIATFLARHGFVVVSLNHPGDNYRDRSGLGTDRVLIGRELQASALISAAIADRTLGASIDRTRIGAAGFSAGGYTALLLAGAVPDFGLLRGYCTRHPNDPEFCSGWSVVRSRPPLRAVRDPRVRAVFTMAPVGIYFDRNGLSGVRVPVDLWAAAQDRVLLVPENAGKIEALLPNRPRYTLVPGAGHFAFLSPCTPMLARRAPLLCADAPGFNRAAMHARMNADALRFFTTAL